jgi:hypothetical protein
MTPEPWTEEDSKIGEAACHFVIAEPIEPDPPFDIVWRTFRKAEKTEKPHDNRVGVLYVPNRGAR